MASDVAIGITHAVFRASGGRLEDSRDLCDEHQFVLEDASRRGHHVLQVSPNSQLPMIVICVETCADAQERSISDLVDEKSTDLVSLDIMCSETTCLFQLGLLRDVFLVILHD